MGRATTRQSHIRGYEACRTCPDNTSGYGKCKKGYDNFYKRKGKDNKCEKCMKCEKDIRLTKILDAYIKSLG